MGGLGKFVRALTVVFTLISCYYYGISLNFLEFKKKNLDEFRLIIYNDEIHKRENEIERDGHFFGKKYSKDIAKYEYMEGRYYSKFTYSLLKNLYPENRRYVKSRLALIRIIIINLTA